MKEIKKNIKKNYLNNYNLYIKFTLSFFNKSTENIIK